MQISNKEEFQRQTQSLDEMLKNLDSGDLPTANIIVAGITGSGKSTLINAVFGQNVAKTGAGRPITDRIDEYNSPEIPIRIWDTVGLELDSNKTAASIANIRKAIANKSTSKNQFDRIHAIWYCIQSGSNRYQGAELKFIQELHSMRVPFIIILTQCITGEPDDDFEKEIIRINNENGLTDISTVKVLASDYPTLMGTIGHYGLEELVGISLTKLPDFIKDGFIAAQRVDVVVKRSAAEKILIQHIEDSRQDMWDKIPLVNIFTASDKLQKMFQNIGTLYNSYLPMDSITKITTASKLDIWDFINPFSDIYTKVLRMINKKRNTEGFETDFKKLNKNEKVPIVIALYGYTFIESIEQLWDESTEDQLRDLSYLVNNLIRTINKKLKKLRLP